MGDAGAAGLRAGARSALGARGGAGTAGPLPVGDLGQIHAVRGDVLPVLDELVAHLLHGVGAAVAELGQALDDVDDEVEAVELIEHAHVKRRCDRALLDVAADEHVLVVAGVRQLVDDLKITDYIINYFLSDKYAYGGELQEKAFSSYVKDVCLKASVYYSQGTGFSSRQKLIGITSVDAASELAPVSGNSITYFEGYDESIFTSNKAVCLVSTAAAEELSQDTDNNGNVILTVQMSPAATGEASTQISLEIAGTYSSKSQTIYCPFSCVAAVQTELDGKITGDSLSATVRDNHELDEFRQILMRHFANVDPSGHQEEINNSPALRYLQFAITVHDETLRETLNALNRNLQTLYRLKPIFACIEVMIGAAAGFFYIHIRRREFAIARSLGTKRIETVIMVFVEICLMFLVGAAIGTILILFVQETATQYAMAAALFFAMNVGAITACLMATGKSGIRLLREVE